MPKPLAVQLYTFRDPGAVRRRRDWASIAETLDAIAGIGYLGVETVDVPGGDPIAARRALGDGRPRGRERAHLGADRRRRRLRARGRRASRRSVADTIIVSGAGFDVGRGRRARSPTASNAARRVVAARHGLRLGYHNHSAEMRPSRACPSYRRLARARSTPRSCSSSTSSGSSSAGRIAADGHRRARRSRIVSLHVKDGVTLPARRRAASRSSTCRSATGVVDIAAVDRGRRCATPASSG